MRHDETVSYSLSTRRLEIGEFGHALELFDADKSGLIAEIEVKVQWNSEWIEETPATLEEPAEAGYYHWTDLCILSAKWKAIAGTGKWRITDKYKFPLHMTADFSALDNAELWEWLRNHIGWLLEDLPDSYYEEAYE